MAVASIFIVFTACLSSAFYRVKCDDIQKNVVVMTGSDKVLHCAGGQPFRWYIYPPSNPTDDKVIFMGERMANDVDPRYQIYTKPDNFPFNSLDLLITDVRSDIFGTYKCQKSMTAHCAELIVLGSEPKCNIYDVTGDTVQLKCDINITVNGIPEMNCVHKLNKTVIHTVCTERDGESAICTVNVPASLKDDYTCVIGVKYQPILSYRVCEHATNKPDYKYIWHTSTSINSKYPSECRIEKLPLLITSVLTIVVIFVLAVGVLCIRLRQHKDKIVADGELSKENETLHKSSDTPETPPPRYEYCSLFSLPKNSVISALT